MLKGKSLKTLENKGFEALLQLFKLKPDKEGLPKGNWYPLRPWWAA